MAVTKNEIILKRFNEYIKNCVQRCKDYDVKITRKRYQKIRKGCQDKIVFEETPDGLYTFNLLFLLNICFIQRMSF